MSDRCYICNRTAGEIKKYLTEPLYTELEFEKDKILKSHNLRMEKHNEYLETVSEFITSVKALPEEILPVKLESILSEPSYFSNYQEITKNAQKLLSDVMKDPSMFQNVKKDINSFNDFLIFLEKLSVILPGKTIDNNQTKLIKRKISKIEEMNDRELFEHTSFSLVDRVIPLCKICLEIVSTHGPQSW